MHMSQGRNVKNIKDSEKLSFQKINFIVMTPMVHYIKSQTKFKRMTIRMLNEIKKDRNELKLSFKRIQINSYMK